MRFYEQFLTSSSLGAVPALSQFVQFIVFFGVCDLDSRYSFAVWPGHAASCLAVWQFIWLSPPVSPEYRLEHTRVQVSQYRDLHRQSSFRPISLKRSLSIRLPMNLLQSMLAGPTSQGTAQIVQRKQTRRPSITNQRSKVASAEPSWSSVVVWSCNGREVAAGSNPVSRTIYIQ